MNLVPLRSLLFVLVSVFSAAHAQTVPVISTTILPAAALQKDVQGLRRSYESLHPGLYRYSSKAEMDRKFDQLAKRLDKDQSLAEAYLALSEFAAKVKCGHTYANFSNQTDPVANELFKNSDRVPFYFIWLNGAMVVTRDFTPDHLLPVGTEVLAVNSIPTKLILSRLMTIARADGSNDAKRIASLAVRGDGKYETFDVFFPLMFPQSSPTMRLISRDQITRPRRLASSHSVTKNGWPPFPSAKGAEMVG